MKALGKIATAPFWALFWIAAVPFLLIAFLGNGWPKREDGESWSFVMARRAAFVAIITGVLAWIVKLGLSS